MKAQSCLAKDWTRSKKTCLFLLLMTICMVPGCGSIFYTKTPTGKFSGKLDVEWIAPNEFIYRPHPADPLIYMTSDGKKIQPRAMYTDGGSIPRLFWSAPGFGPWDFAPGYIMHDWLFTQHHCKEGGWQAYDFPRSAEILAEAIKTQMVTSGTSEPTVVWAIYEAVSTPLAKQLWESGECKKQPASVPTALLSPDAKAAPVPNAVKLLTIEIS